MAGLTREVLSLQFGHYSNFIGSHFWNIQESSFTFDRSNPNIELNHDVMFREGLTRRNEITYTPRLLIFDLKDSLGSLRQEGLLYNEDISDGISNQAPIVKIESQNVAEKNEFLKDFEELDEKAASGNLQIADFASKVYNLNDTVNFWSDYLRLHLHPKTVSIANRYRFGSETEPFDIFPLGQNLYKDASCHEDLEDRIHFFVEECDSLQGFNVSVDTNNACGGLCYELIEELCDDYSNKCVMTWGASPPFLADASIDSHYWLQNMLVSYVKLADVSSAFIPLTTSTDITRFPNPTLTLPHVIYQPELQYHSSALLALGIETATLPFRLHSNRCSLAELCSVLTPHGRKVLSLAGAFPFALNEDATLFDTLLSRGDELPWQYFTPGLSSSIAATAQSVVVRGIKPSMMLNPNNPETLKLGPCNSVSDMMDFYFRDVCPNTLTSTYDVTKPTKTVAPFPHIFGSLVADDGLITKAQRPDSQSVKSIPAITSLQSTTGISKLFNDLMQFAKSFPLHRYPRMRDAGLEEDEYKETINKLQSLHDNYCDDVDML